MDNEKDLQRQIDELKARLDAFNFYRTIPLEVNNAFNARGFIQSTFFVAGTGTIGAAGNYRLVIPGATRTSIVLVTSFSGSNIGAQLTAGFAEINFGAADSQFDITNPSGNTFRYTWDGTGTDPGISATTMPAGSRVVIFSSNFDPANQNSAIRPYFTVTGSGANYFEVENFTPGVVESNKTIGAGGSITGGAQNSTYEMLVEGTATDEFAFVVFLFDKLYVQN